MRLFSRSINSWEPKDEQAFRPEAGNWMAGAELIPDYDVSWEALPAAIEDYGTRQVNMQELKTFCCNSNGQFRGSLDALR